MADKPHLDFYLTREPILDRGWNIAGFEIVLRSQGGNPCDFGARDPAPSRVIEDEVLGECFDYVSGGKPALMDYRLLSSVSSWKSLLPPDRTIIEVSKTSPADDSTLPACRTLQEGGYAVTLETSRDDDRTQAFAPFVDILKVDFQEASAADQAGLVRRYKDLNLRMLARNVRTDAQFQDASRLGYDFFQGPFFTSPSVQRTSKVPASSLSSLRLLQLVQREEMDLDAIEDAIRHDIALSHSLLRYLNSAAFTWVSPIESVRRGLVLLGVDGTRKWVSMASLRALTQNRPPVLVAQVLTRGCFCESLIDYAKLFRGDADPFMTGMFSLLDAIMERPLPQILDELRIGSRVRGALLGTASPDDPLFLALKIVKAYESSDFSVVRAAGLDLGLSSGDLRKCYLDSLRWVESFGGDQGTWPVTKQSDRRGFHRTKPAVTVN